jgi:hypothetical protein
MRRGVVFLIFMLAASSTPALADLLNVELTIRIWSVPPPSTWT